MGTTSLTPTEFSGMKRILMAAAVLVFTAATSTAGPIRDRIAARFSRPCQQPQQPQQVQYIPAPQFQHPTYQPQPVQQVAYYPPAGFAPAVSGGCVNGVCPVK